MNICCLNVMPKEIRDAVARELDEKDEEIRIRANRPIMLLGPKKREIQYNVTSEECERMPLRYNYDKPEKPRISRVFGYQARFFILFQPEKSSREVVIS